jgi:hypothetical protein
MRNESCPQEIAVVAAKRSGQWADSLAAHVESCPRCRETIRINGWMQTLASAVPKHRPLPDADLLWIKSTLFSRQAAADRAWGPLDVGGTLARAVVGALAAAWLALNWPVAQGHLPRLWAQLAERDTLAQLSTSPWPLTLASIVVAGALAAVALAVYPLLSRK